MHTNRGSFVATPTAELSNQEETLVGDILDWSLDASCSGYEGDQDSDGEKECEGEQTKFKNVLNWTILYFSTKPPRSIKYTQD